MADCIWMTETNTTLALSAGELVYTNEDADNANVALISTDANNDLSAGTDGRLYIDAAAGETNTTLALSAGELVYTNEDADNANVALISTDANNDISAGTDGRLYLDAITSETNTTLALSAGELVYTNEDADNANVALISTDANNDLSAGTDGRLYIDAAAGETNTTLALSAGELVYTNEDADNANVALISTDANNDISAGTDGRLFLDAAASETNTTLALSAGELVYTNEDADNANVALISTDANNDISAGTDGRLFLDAAASETNTTLALSAGELVYTNEDADNANVALISNDANNDISAGTDGRLFLDAAASETNTTLALSAGELVYTNEDADNANVALISTDANNDISAGTDGRLYLDAITSETNTTLALSAGELVYTNEDADNANVALISTDANNDISAGTDGRLYVDQTNTTLSLTAGELVYTNEDADNANVDLISADANNDLAAGTDGGLYLNVSSVSIAETNTTLGLTAAAQLAYVNEQGNNANVPLISTDANNDLAAGSDGRLFVDASAGETNTTLALSAGELVYTNEDADNANVALISTDANNDIAAGTDGRLFLDAAASETNTTLALSAGELVYTNEDADNANVALISTDANNDISAGTDGRLFLDAAASETNTTLALSAGELVYTNEDADNANVALISTDANNDLSAGTDGRLYIDAAAGETNTTLALSAGELVYTNEDADNANVALISTDANNDISAGTDGRLYLDAAASETNTTLGISAGALVYTNEDADNANVALISTDANNDISAGTDGRLYLDAAASETNTTLGISAGALVYTNEDADNANVALISTDANNDISAGTDGRLYLDAVTSETNTTLGISAGALVYTNEDADNANVALISTDANNDISAGTDGRLYLDAAASETNTTLGISAGALVYTNEDADNANVALISTDANNDISAGTDGRLYLDAAASETNTTLGISAGALVYTNEDADNANVALISTDANNDLSAGTDGRLYMDQTNTTLSLTAGELVYTNEDADNANVDLISADANNDLAAGTDGGLYLNVSSVSIAETNTTLGLNASAELAYTNEQGNNANVALISTDANNDISAGSDGRLYLDAAASETNTTLGISAGALVYTNEDADNANVALISTDANNDISAGTDGRLFLDAAASETNTTLALSAGELVYTNEDADNANVALISTDANNDISAGTDGRLYLDAAASETNTTLGISAGALVYTNEDADNANVALISTDANNDISAGTDGRLYLDAVTSETNTTLGISAGALVYTNEDADNANVALISTDANNDISAGTDGRLYLDAAASETNTTLGISAGALVYTNEDADNANVALISTDANNDISAGTDGRLYLDAAASETNTTLGISAGALVYTNEDADNANVALISTDANNDLSAGTDGRLYMDQTNTTLSLTAGELVYTNEDADNANVDLISADANNDLAAGTDGGLYLNVSSVSIAETNTTLGLNASAELAYTNEQGNNANVALISTDANNDISAGTDGRLYLDAITSETNTTLALSAGELVYTNEDADNANVALISTDANNDISAGTDGRLYLDAVTSETNTTLGISAGALVYTNDADNANVALISTDANNDISAGTDGRLYLDAAASETNTTLGISAGALVYTNEDADNANVALISTDANNDISAGTDGRLYLDAAASETNTTLGISAGALVYTNEDADNANVALISTDANNDISAGTDGRLYLDAAASETNTTLGISAGALVYTNEDADNANVALISTDANNDISAGTDGRLYLDAVTSETNTTLGISAGALVYTNEDADNANVALISTDANNDISAGTDGRLYLDAAASETNTTLGISAGALVYTNEDADNANVALISTDANNDISAGTDGRLYLDAAASETNTTLGISAGALVYTNEDADNANVALISTDANNDISAGTDGRLYLDAAASETNTTLGISAGALVYTNEDADNANVALISTDANNDISAGTDGRLYLDAAASETNTTLGISAGALVYTNEDADNANVALISTDANNDISAGTDGRLYLDAAASETNTTLGISAGALVYTNEDADNANVALISTDANNDISAGTDGRLYLDAVTSETNTTLGISAGALVYTNEDADNANVSLISTDANNDISAGSDGRLYLDAAASETNTTLGISAGALVYTNEDADNANVALISTDANNDISAGSDGRLYLDAAASETNTTLGISAGALVYTNEDADNANVALISTDANNDISAGSDGRLYLDAVTAETNTTLGISAGQLVYTNEDADNANVALISTDANNDLSAGTDGRLYVTASETALTITTDGTGTGVSLSGTSNHTADITLLSSDANNLATIGTDGGIHVNASGTTAAKLVFSAEYAGAVLQADGSDNIISMNGANSGAPTFMNYYEVRNFNTDGGTNDYDIIVRFTLPEDFDSWSSSPQAIIVDYQGTADASFQADIYEEGSGTALQSNTALSGSGVASWSERTIGTATNMAGLTAGDTGIIVFKLIVTDAGTADTSIIRLGDITLNYNKRRL